MYHQGENIASIFFFLAWPVALFVLVYIHFNLRKIGAEHYYTVKLLGLLPSEVLEGNSDIANFLKSGLIYIA